jgi:hypothetical protein
MVSQLIPGMSWSNIVKTEYCDDDDEFCSKNLILRNKNQNYEGTKLSFTYDTAYNIMFKKPKYNIFYPYTRFIMDIVPKFIQLTDWEISSVSIQNTDKLPIGNVVNSEYRNSQSAKTELINIVEITNMVAKKINKSKDEIDLVEFKQIKYTRDSFFSLHSDNIKSNNYVATVLFIDGSQHFTGSDLFLGDTSQYSHSDVVKISLHKNKWNCIIFDLEVPHSVSKLLSGERIVYKATIKLKDNNIKIPIKKIVMHKCIEETIINLVKNNKKFINNDFLIKFCNNYKSYIDTYEINESLIPPLKLNEFADLINNKPQKNLHYFRNNYFTLKQWNMNLLYIITKIWEPLDENQIIELDGDGTIKPYLNKLNIKNFLEYLYRVYYVAPIIQPVNNSSHNRWPSDWSYGDEDDFDYGYNQSQDIDNDPYGDED